MRTIWLRLAACLVAGACSVGASAQTTSSVDSSQVQRQLNLTDGEGYRRGDCKTPVGVEVDMKRVLFLSNDWVEIGSAEDPVRLRIDGRTLVVQYMNRRLADGRPDEVSTPLRAALSNDIDGNVDFSLAFSEGAPAIYWREPYQFRRFRQGLMRMVGEDPQPWCEGEGGIEIIH